MQPNLFPTYSFLLIILTSLAAHDEHRVLGENNERYANCSVQVKCANMEIGYPFYGGKRLSYCGYPGYELRCGGDAPELMMMDVNYRVLEINNSSQEVTVARADYWNGTLDSCPDKYVNTTLDATLFNYTSNFPNLTLYYDCRTGIQNQRYVNSFDCSEAAGSNISGLFTVTGSDTIMETCMENVTIPISQSAADGIAGSIDKAITMNLLSEALAGGFGLELVAINNSLCKGCVRSGGRCGYNSTSEEFACFCPDMPYTSTCPNNTNTELCEACVVSGGLCGYNRTSDEFACNCSDISYAFTCPNNTTPFCEECVASGGRCSNNQTSNEFKCNCGDLPFASACPSNIDTSLCKECAASGGLCDYIHNQTSFSCLCGDLPYPFTCSRSSYSGISRVRKKLIIGITAGVAGIIVVVAMFGCCRVIKRCLATETLLFWQKESEDDENVKAFIRDYGSLAPKRYSYTDIKRMSNSFTCKLGQGGFGSVYKGKLPDGRMVAVKLLNKSKGNGQDFINEVASISRTSHVNIVTLLGFCFERRRRALVYEFMPNGSLDKFIFNGGSSNEILNLEWTTMYQIAVGIARGLEYLYRGCNTRILHFDIKPHNILLDQNFIPKISDFGLAKLCQTKESMVSMTQARGTAGYIAPEVFCRNFGGVSHKSDVYSYGMLVLEMVGGRKNIDVQVSQASQIHFPTWIYKQLQPGKDLTVLHSITNEEEEEIAKKMVLVSLWCIQPNPSDRPSIDKVVEMLEGSSHLLEIPPNPFMSSQNS